MVIGKVSINPTHKINSKDISSANAPQYRMSFNIKIDGLSLLILHNEDIIGAYNYHWQKADWELCSKNVSSIINENPFTKYNYRSVDVFVDAPESLLYPYEYFLDYSKQQLLDTYIGNSSYLALAQKLNIEAAMMVYAIHRELYAVLKSALVKVKFHHSSAMFIDKVLKENKQGQNISLIIANDSFEIMASEGDKLIAHNNFSYKTIDEFMFLLLSFVNQQQYDTKVLSLKLYDDLLMDSPIALQLTQFFSNIVEYNNGSVDDKELIFSTIKNNTIIANS